MPIHRVRGPNGEIHRIEAPEGATQEQVMAFFNDRQSKQPIGADSGSMATRGMTAGLSDYVGAAGRVVGDRILGAFDVGDTGDLSYEQALRNVRGDVERYREKSPIAATSSEVVGAVASPIFQKAAGVVGGVLKNAPRYAQYAGQGLTGGALYGAGTAENEQGGVPTVTDVAKNAAGYGAAGAAGGVAIPAAAQFIAKPVYNRVIAPAINRYFVPAFKAVTNKLPTNADTAAAQRIAHRIWQDGGTADDIGRELQKLGKQGTLVDAGGQNIKNQTKALIQAPGETANRARQSFEARQGGQTDRLVRGIRQNVSSKDFYGEVEDIAARQIKKASPLYRRAYTKYQNLTSGWLRNAYEQDPLIKKGIAKGIASLKREATISGEKFDGLKYGVIDFDASGAPILGKEMPLSVWHAARRGLDEILDGMRDTVTGKLPKAAGQITRLRSALDAELKMLTGGKNGLFARADALYSGPAKMSDALWRGRRFANGDEEMTAKIFNGLSKSEQNAFRIGAAREMTKWIRNHTSENTLPPKLRQILKPGSAMWERVKVISNNPQRFMRDLQREATFSESNSLRFGSPTGMLRAEQNDMGLDLVGAAMDAATQTPINASRSALRHAFNWIRDNRIPQHVRDRMGEMLLSKDPAMQRKVLDMIRDMEFQKAAMKATGGQGNLRIPPGLLNVGASRSPVLLSNTGGSNQ